MNSEEDEFVDFSQLESKKKDQFHFDSFGFKLFKLADPDV